MDKNIDLNYKKQKVKKPVAKTTGFLKFYIIKILLSNINNIKVQQKWQQKKYTQN